MVCQVAFGEKAALRLHSVSDSFGHRSKIEAVSAALSHLAQGEGQMWILEDFSFLRCPSIGHEGLSKMREVLEHFCIPTPIISNDFREWEAIFCISNSGLKNLCQIQLTPFVVQFLPSIHTARHTDGQGPQRGNFLKTRFNEIF